MKKLIYLVAAFSAILTSCSNEDVISGTPQSPTSSTITATISQKGTRVAMGQKYEEDDDYYNPLLWEAGDAVRVINYGAQTSGEYITSNSGKTATFSKTSGEDIVVEDMHLACYPASAWTGYLTEDAPLKFTFPSKQNYTPGTVDKDALPLVAENSSGTEFEFMPFAAVLRLNVMTTSTTANVNSIIITSKSKCLSGTFVANGEALIAENADKSATLVCETPVAINSTTGVDFCVVVPSNGYDGGDLTITVNTDNGSFEKTSKYYMSLFVGNVYDFDIVVGDPMPPTTGTAKATIGGAEVDVNWVQLWENGPKFAEYNVGVTDGKAESYGGYYAWGGSQDKIDDHYTGTEELSGDNDTATKLWGSNWRMPTQAELQALFGNCEVEWTTVNGVNGRKFTGKGGYTSNSVFLPAAGYFGNGYVYGQGGFGSYWSSTPSGSNAYSLYFQTRGCQMYDSYRDYCNSVRAVLK